MRWLNNEILSKECDAVCFYLSNHTLEDYKDVLEQHRVKLFKDFESGNENECNIAGTIMSIKEKKTAKGTPFAII